MYWSFFLICNYLCYWVFQNEKLRLANVYQHLFPHGVQPFSCICAFKIVFVNLKKMAI